MDFVEDFSYGLYQGQEADEADLQCSTFYQIICEIQIRHICMLCIIKPKL